VNINSMSVLLGCAGLLVGSIGIVAQDISRQPADLGTVQSADAAWPPAASAAGVIFHDEMIDLLTLGATPRARAEPPPQQQPVPAEEETRVRHIRMMRAGGSRRAQFVEIEFIDEDGSSYRRRYPMGQQVFAASDQRSEFEADRSSWEAGGYAPRRSRRSGRGYYRRWW
jgi:hypothetical protein